MAISTKATKAPVVKKPSVASGMSLASVEAAIRRRIGGRVKTSEVIFFTSQLSLMLEVGTSLSVALKALGEQTENPALREVILAMHRDIEEGKQFSEAMRRHPSVFSHVFVSMVKAGETGGFLQKILDRLVEMQEKRQALIAQLRTTLTYPVVLCVICVLVVVFILVWVLPKFTAFFQGKEAILPFTTRFMMALSDSMRSYGWVYALSVFGMGVSLKIFLKSEAGKILVDQVSLRGPVISGLCNKIYTCELLRTLGHLLESKVPLLEALQVNRPTMRNRYYRLFLDEISEEVQQGGRFSQPFAANPHVPESVKQMVATGEETGNLPKVMIRLAEFYDSEVDRELKTIASLIEPAALIVLGAVVGLIVSSVILPLFKIGQAMH